MRPCQERRGESPIGIASSPTQPGYLEFTVQKAGVVISALHDDINLNVTADKGDADWKGRSRR